MQKTILIIEDEPTLQKALTKSLEAEGFKIENALDGETGLNKSLASPPDLILLDLVLPQKNGFEVLSELKSDEKTKRVPVLVLTNLENANDVEKAISLGATGYLVKSNYDLDDIVAKIKEIADQK